MQMVSVNDSLFFCRFLKEIPSERSILFEQYSTELATIRSSLYPNLNYSGLFYGIVNLLDAFPMLVTAQAGEHYSANCSTQTQIFSNC